ncbi:MAG TPA: chorismate lyase, partial [Gammaproteobacteria bacterium]|nr:chorismate lyase [Gammaproteobacteria bacterium]
MKVKQAHGASNQYQLQWRPAASYRHTSIPDELRDWLTDANSLTSRIVRQCDHFRVQVAAQYRQRPMLSEAQNLGIRPQVQGLVRQVHLLCKNRPWVFARTFIPLNTLRGKERRLAYLGDRPLGAYLFARPDMHRGEIEIACIRAGQPLYEMALAGTSHWTGHKRPEQIWGRR